MTATTMLKKTVNINQRLIRLEPNESFEWTSVSNMSQLLLKSNMIDVVRVYIYLGFANRLAHLTVNRKGADNGTPVLLVQRLSTCDMRCP